MAIYSLDGTSPQLGVNHWIAPNATVIGKVRLRDEASVWFGAVLRGDRDWITIGQRSNVQDCCVLHADDGEPLNVGDDCTIGHRAILHSCSIGHGSLIGMGATVLNRAVIGKGSLVGANALVTEGKTFSDYSLIVGSPAKAIRLLDHEAVARLRASAAGYVANWKRFKSGLAPLA